MHKRKSERFKFSINDIPKLLAWASSNAFFSFLNGNDYNSLYGSFPIILFIGRCDVTESSEYSFEKLDAFLEKHADWAYGYLGYDLKNEIEDLKSENPSTIPIHHLGFAIPETVIQILHSSISIESILDPEEIYKQIKIAALPDEKVEFRIKNLSSTTPKWQYLDHVSKIKSSIINGEFYEMNYCIEFTADAQEFDPLIRYLRLNTISPMPFSAFMRLNNKYLICSSPERFLKKEGNKIISQPIKGTERRSFDQKEDEELKRSLKESEKERAENLMIVDLVRNDLAKSAVAGSVRVDELFGVYTFRKVHQMISTVSAEHNTRIKSWEIIKNAFPMGSMTGAPKIRVMQEIETLEYSTRGLYSGSIGFFKPNGDFDLNVVIRSIIYDSSTYKISFHVGSAITYDSDPEYEYNECLLKAESLIEALS